MVMVDIPLRNNYLPPSASTQLLSPNLLRITFSTYFDLKVLDNQAIHFLVHVQQPPPPIANSSSSTVPNSRKRKTTIPAVYCEHWPPSWTLPHTTNVNGTVLLEPVSATSMAKNEDDKGNNDDDDKEPLPDQLRSRLSATSVRIHLQLFEKSSWDGGTYAAETFVWCLRDLLVKEVVQPVGVAGGVLGGSVLHTYNESPYNESPCNEPSSTSPPQSSSLPVIKWSVLEHHEQGYRPHMEDASFHYEFGEGYLLCGIADGHGGAGAAVYVAKHLPLLVEQYIRAQDGDGTDGSGGRGVCRRALYDSMIAVDRQWLYLQHVREEWDQRSGLSSIPTTNNNNSNGEEEDEREQEYDTSGCTCCAMLITPSGLVFVGNVGDTRAVLCRGSEDTFNGDTLNGATTSDLCRGVAVPLSFDQKPTDPRELSRIVEVGGFVTEDGRLGGCIGVARAIGDIDLKQAVTELEVNKEEVSGVEGGEEREEEEREEESGLCCVPDVTECLLSSRDEFIVVACDGLWDVMGSVEVVRWCWFTVGVVGVVGVVSI